MTDRAAALTRWLGQRAAQWQHLAALLRSAAAQRGADPAPLLELVRGFRALGRDLALARALLPGSGLTCQLEALYAQAHEQIYHTPHAFWRGLWQLLCDDTPAVMMRLRGALRAVAALFIVCGVLGWLLVWNYPELAGLFASEEMINQVQQGNLWTDGLLNVVPSAWLSLSIMTNNIAVSLFAFTFGALYGLGTIYIIALNGLMLGGVFALTAHYGIADRLFAFVIAHGVAELSIICLAGAAGVALGEALVRPGAQSRAAAFQAAVWQAAQLLPTCALFLMGAGLIEGFVSPNHSYPLSLRLVIGIGYGFLLWTALTGRLWRIGQSRRTVVCIPSDPLAPP